MSWTQAFDESKLLIDDVGMCLCYSLEACVIAAKRGVKYDVEPETYVEKYFGGVQPTGMEFLKFLNTLGFDEKAIHETVLKSFRETSRSKLLARENASKFFHIFQTEWHVHNDDIYKYIDDSSIYYLIEMAVADAASTKARLNAIKRHSEDPKQQDKALVKECWEDWQKQPKRYKGKAAFARDMRDKFPNLESQAVIEKWCRDWLALKDTKQAE
jgi:hypothetical protein